MVHTRWGLSQLRAAEVRRGCIFSDALDSTANVIKNGGVIGSGAKFVSPKDGFRFSGAAGARISYGDVLRNPMSAITIMAWFKTTSTASAIYIICQRYNTSSPAGAIFGFRLSNPGILNFGLDISGNNRITGNATGVWNDGAWHFAVGTWSSGAKLKLYIDGVLNRESPSAYSGEVQVVSGEDELTIGSSYDGTSDHYNFAGNIRDCKIFSTALDADEIAAYYRSTAFQYVPVIALPMRIEDHDITNVRTLDRSGLMNHAVLGDGVTSTTYPTKRSTGPGYTFDGTTDYMQGRDTISFTNSCTFGAACRFDANSLRTVMSHGDPGDLFVLGAGVEGGVGTNNILNFAMYSGSWKVASSGVVPLVGKIYTLFGTYDGATLKVYVDGKYMGSNTAAPDNRALSVRIGRRWAAGTPNYFDGDIFEAFVSNRCLTAMQVADMDIRMRECLRGC